MPVTTTTALIFAAASIGSAAIGALSQPGRPSVPGVPKTPLSDPVKTQAELDIEARRVRVKRARLNQSGVGTTPLGLGLSDKQKTLPKLTGE